MRTILRNAKIWLGGDQFASAVLFDSSQILAVGTDAQVEAQRQNGDQIAKHFDWLKEECSWKHRYKDWNC